MPVIPIKLLHFINPFQRYEKRKNSFDFYRRLEQFFSSQFFYFSLFLSPLLLVVSFCVPSSICWLTMPPLFLSVLDEKNSRPVQCCDPINGIMKTECKRHIHSYMDVIFLTGYISMHGHGIDRILIIKRDGNTYSATLQMTANRLVKYVTEKIC